MRILDNININCRFSQIFLPHHRIAAKPNFSGLSNRQETVLFAIGLQNYEKICYHSVSMLSRKFPIEACAKSAGVKGT